MEMMYKIFFEVRIDHPYYVESRPELVWIPTEETRSILRRYQLQVRDTGLGIGVLVPQAEDVAPSFEPAEKLVFNVYPLTAAFGVHTDITPLDQRKMLVFTNEALPAGEEALSYDLDAIDGPGYHGFPMVARVVIALANVSAEVIYKVSFSTTAITWRYYLLTTQEAAEIAIVDRENGLVFKQLTLPDDTADPVALGLRTTFPDISVALFESTTPINLQDKFRKNIQLVVAEDIVFEHLPNPTAEEQGIKIIKVLK